MKPGSLRVLVASSLIAFLPFLRAAQEKPSSREAAEEPAKASEKDKLKLFQLDEIIIDVIEKARDIEIPNMTVVKPELFPMSIGTTLDTALERQAGLDIQRIQEVGTAMDDDSIRIRGMSGRRIKVLRNGRLLNTSGAAGGYFIDFDMIPLTDVDRVEIVKGVGDARYGNVLGGIINLVPRRLPSAAPVTEAELSLASFSSSGVNLHHAYKPGALEYSLAGGASASDGYLRNGNTKLASFNAHVGYDFPFKGRLTADIGYSRFRKGFIVSNRVSKDFDNPGYRLAGDPGYAVSDGEYMYGGMGAYPEPGSWWIKNKWLAEMGYEQSLGDKGVLDVSYWRNHGNREAFNTRSALNRTFHKVFYDDRSQGFSASCRHAIGRHSLAGGVEYGHLNDDGDANKPDDFRSPFRNGNYVSVRNLAVYLTADLSLWKDRLILTPGIRFMSYDGEAGPAGKIELIPDIRMSGWAPALKLTYSCSGENVLYVSLARALRMPTAPEHYWHYDPDDAGVNTSGLPFHNEDGLMVQAGWRASLPTKTRIEISPYIYRIKNYIQFDLINFVSYNIRKARIIGIETEVSQPLGRGWSAFFNHTWQASRTRGDMFIPLFVDPLDAGFNELPGLPRNKLNAGFRYRTRRNVSAGLFAQVVSRQKVIYNNNTLYNTRMRVRTQDGYARLDAEFRCPLFPGFEANLFLRNILDARYQERFGFPAAGRTAGLSIKTEF